jgi:serine/threonine protein kinase
MGGGVSLHSKTNSNSKGEAVKVVWKSSLKNKKQQQKLISEIKIHQNMSHPNIVLFKSVFEDDENVYMILEFCEEKVTLWISLSLSHHATLSCSHFYFLLSL